MEKQQRIRTFERYCFAEFMTADLKYKEVEVGFEPGFK